MIDNGVNISWDGTKGTVSGIVKYNEDMEDLFGPEQGTGHFFPIRFEDKYFGHTMLVTGRKDGDVEVTPTEEDPYLILRLENFGTSVPARASYRSSKVAPAAAPTDAHPIVKVKDTGVVVFDLDFSEADIPDCPVGADAFKEKDDYGEGFGKTSDFYEDGEVDILWDGTNAVVLGTLNYVNTKHHTGCEKLNFGTHYFAFSLVDWFKDKDIKVKVSNEKTVRDIDWVCSVDKARTITVKYGDTLIAEFDLSNVDFKSNVGEDVIRIAGQDEAIGDIISKSSDLISDNVYINWDGTNGTLWGNVHWHDFTSSEHFKKNPTGHFIPIVIENHDNDTFTVSGGTYGEVDVANPKWVIRVDDLTDKKVTFKVKNEGEQGGELLLAELDCSHLKLEQNPAPSDNQ